MRLTFFVLKVDKHESSHHTAAIALGSNLGDRFANIELALRLLEAPQNLFKVDDDDEERFVAVVDTSFMYESAPMYVTDQPAFINCACVVRIYLPSQFEFTFLITFWIG